jgi:Holliday junction resolvasome RuvABC endonuclease subunit
MPHSPELYPRGILALDLATATGWAAWNGTVRVSGVERFSRLKNEPKGLLYLGFDQWLLEMLHRANPALVVYEQPAAVRSRPAAAILYGLETRVWQACDRRDEMIPYRGVQLNILKKWTAGDGHAEKTDMVAAVKRRFFSGVSRVQRLALDDNEADAIALLEYARAELVPNGAHV